MERYKIPLVNGSGRTIGYGDRWWAHRVRDGPDGLILGHKHVGITIACLDDDGRILVQPGWPVCVCFRSFSFLFPTYPANMKIRPIRKTIPANNPRITATGIEIIN